MEGYLSAKKMPLVRTTDDHCRISTPSYGISSLSRVRSKSGSSTSLPSSSHKDVSKRLPKKTTLQFVDEDVSEEPLPKKTIESVNTEHRKKRAIILSSDSETEEIPRSLPLCKDSKKPSPKKARLDSEENGGEEVIEGEDDEDYCPIHIVENPKKDRDPEEAKRRRQERKEEQERIAAEKKMVEQLKLQEKKKNFFGKVSASGSQSQKSNRDGPKLQKMNPSDFFSKCKEQSSVPLKEPDVSHKKLAPKKTVREESNSRAVTYSAYNDEETEIPLNKNNGNSDSQQEKALKRCEKKSINAKPIDASANIQTPEKMKKNFGNDNEFVESSSDEEVPSMKRKKASPLQKENTVISKAPCEKIGKNASSYHISKSPLKLTSGSILHSSLYSSSCQIGSSSSGSGVVAMEMPWVDKHKPKNLQQLVGQQGDKSPLNKLLVWLRDWARHNLGEGAKIKKPKPAPWMAQQDGIPFKAALLSGSPGVGKTSCAHLVCENLGLKFVEMNASDVRNKKHLDAQVAQLTGSHQIEQFFGRSSDASDPNQVHHVLIMDEVDGMSGNEDRAGVAELIQIIKDTKIPILCICNDRNHPKIRSLSNYCYDLRFSKPRVEQIRARVMSIAYQEKIKIAKEELDELIALSNHDVRQTIYNLQMRGSSSMDKRRNITKKDCVINPFEAAVQMMSPMSSLLEKQDMFFVDYSIMPLFLQQNYINMKDDKHTAQQAIHGLRKAADLISWGDTVDKCIRSTGAWKLLNDQGMLSCSLPASIAGGRLRGMVQFPAWLGKNSTTGKHQRMLRQIAVHSHLKTTATAQSLLMDYVPIFREKLTRPLLEKECDGVSSVVSTMCEYDLVRDDAEAVGELAVYPGKIDPAVKILPKVKAALTRALGKEHHMLPYSLDDVSRGRKRPLTHAELDEEGNLIERMDNEEEEMEEDSDNDEKTKRAIPKPASRGRGGTSTRGSSHGGLRGRGRGKAK